MRFCFENRFRLDEEEGWCEMKETLMAKARWWIVFYLFWCFLLLRYEMMVF